jgi:hypothetical protein
MRKQLLALLIIVGFTVASFFVTTALAKPTKNPDKQPVTKSGCCTTGDGSGDRETSN